MALDPAWWNNLIDDDGSGAVGTIWNKATIKGLTDNINAEISRLDQAQNFWTIEVRASGGGVPSYTSRTAFYVRTGKFCWIGFKVVFTKGSLVAGSSILLSVPFPIVNTGVPFGGVQLPWFVGLSQPVASLGTVSTPGNDYMTLVYVPAGGGTVINYFITENFGTGTIELAGSGSYAIA